MCDKEKLLAEWSKVYASLRSSEYFRVASTARKPRNTFVAITLWDIPWSPRDTPGGNRLMKAQSSPRVSSAHGDSTAVIGRVTLERASRDKTKWGLTRDHIEQIAPHWQSRILNMQRITSDAEQETACYGHLIWFESTLLESRLLLPEALSPHTAVTLLLYAR